MAEQEEKQPAIITVGESELGYCMSCFTPSKVVPVSFLGWLHRVWVCSGCLTQMSAKVQR